MDEKQMLQLILEKLDAHDKRFDALDERIRKVELGLRKLDHKVDNGFADVRDDIFYLTKMMDTTDMEITEMHQKSAS